MAYNRWQSLALVIITNILMNTFILYSSTQFAFTLEFTKTFFVVVYITMLVTYLFYPLFGCLGDRCGTRYRITLIGLLCIITATIAGISISIANYYNMNKVQNKKYFWTYLSIVMLILMAGMGLVNTNVLKLGLDQLLNNSVTLLLSLVRGYYWSLHIGPLVMYYILAILFMLGLFHNRKYNHKLYHQTGGGGVFLNLCTQLVFITITFVGFCLVRKVINIVPPSKKSLLMIFKVCGYGCCYKISKTSTESEVFIDAGKPSHGGPFEDSDVEDVKKFFKTLSIFFPLIAFHFTGDTYSLGELLINSKESCPSLAALLMVGINPNHIPHLVIIIGVPLYQLLSHCAAKQYMRISLNKRIITGLTCSLMAVLARLMIMLFTQSIHQSHQSDEENTNNFTSEVTRYCFDLRIHDNITMSSFSDDTNNIYWFLLLPQIFSGFGYVLVAMTTLEYICSHTSEDIQGTLVGLWYSTNSIRLIIGITDVYTLNNHLQRWYILQSSQLVGCIIFSALFLLMAYNSTYCELETSFELPPATRYATCRVATVTRGNRRKRGHTRHYGAV